MSLKIRNQRSLVTVTPLTRNSTYEIQQRILFPIKQLSTSIWRTLVFNRPMFIALDVSFYLVSGNEIKSNDKSPRTEFFYPVKEGIKRKIKKRNFSPRNYEQP